MTSPLQVRFKLTWCNNPFQFKLVTLYWSISLLIMTHKRLRASIKGADCFLSRWSRRILYSLKSHVLQRSCGNYSRWLIDSSLSSRSRSGCSINGRRLSHSACTVFYQNDVCFVTVQPTVPRQPIYIHNWFYSEWYEKGVCLSCHK